MATDIHNQHTNTAEQESVTLTQRLSRYAVAWSVLPLCIWLSALFVYFNNIPLFHTDLWGHVAYGDWIIENRSLPEEDPFLQLAEGVPVVDSAWLGQVILAEIDSLGGAHGLSAIFALIVTSTYAVLVATGKHRSQFLIAAIIGSALTLFFGATRIAIIRPEIFGTLCFAIVTLIWARFAEQHSTQKDSIDRHTNTPVALTWFYYMGIAVVFMLWANLHGSFVVGFAFIGCSALGRLLEVLWCTGGVKALLLDRVFRRRVILCEVALAGSLVNPYGIDSLINALTFPRNPNLADVLEWERLELIHAEGILFALSWVLLVVLMRFSRVPVRPADVLMLIVFNLAFAWRVRMATWYSIVFMYVMLPHLGSALQRLGQYARTRFNAFGGQPDSAQQTIPKRRSIVATALCGLVLWYGFALSPFGNQSLGGTEKPDSELYSSMTPRELTAWLKDNPPEGQVWNPQWWGDWIVWDGPEQIDVFMTTNAVHVAPSRVWNDYLTVARGQTGWQQVLDRYNVSTLIIHKELQPGLTRSAQELSQWDRVYEDRLAIVYQRRPNSPNENRVAEDPIVPTALAE